MGRRTSKNGSYAAAGFSLASNSGDGSRARAVSLHLVSCGCGGEADAGKDELATENVAAHDSVVRIGLQCHLLRGTAGRDATDSETGSGRYRRNSQSGEGDA